MRETHVVMVCGGAMAGRKRFDDRRRHGRRQVIFSLCRVQRRRRYRRAENERAGARTSTGGDGRERGEREADARTPLSVGHDEDSCERQTGGGRSGDGGVNDNDGAQSLTAHRRANQRWSRGRDVAESCALPDPFNSATMPPNERARGRCTILHTGHHRQQHTHTPKSNKT